MSIPSVDHLLLLRNDFVKFELERERLIRDYIKSIPEEHRHATFAMQCKIDVARMTMPEQEFLEWMVREAAEMAANMDDQFSFIGHTANNMKKVLDAGKTE